MERQKRRKSPEQAVERFKQKPYAFKSLGMSKKLMKLTHLPWGGCYLAPNYTAQLVSTCTFDNTMYILYAFHELTALGKQYLSEKWDAGDRMAEAVIRIVTSIRRKNFDRAKSTWLDSCDFSETPEVKFPSLKSSRALVISCYGTEYDYALHHVFHWFPIRAEYRCINQCCKMNGQHAGHHTKTFSSLTSTTMEDALEKLTHATSSTRKYKECGCPYEKNHTWVDGKPLPLLLFFI